MDIWSLGCVILEAATGRKPWVNLDNEWAIMWNIAGGQKPQLPSPDQLSPAGIDFLNRCFEREPTKRGTAAELLQHDWVSFEFVYGEKSPAHQNALREKERKEAEAAVEAAALLLAAVVKAEAEPDPQLETVLGDVPVFFDEKDADRPTELNEYEEEDLLGSPFNPFYFGSGG